MVLRVYWDISRFKVHDQCRAWSWRYWTSWHDWRTVVLLAQNVPIDKREIHKNESLVLDCLAIGSFRIRNRGPTIVIQDFILILFRKTSIKYWYIDLKLMSVVFIEQRNITYKADWRPTETLHSCPSEEFQLSKLIISAYLQRTSGKACKGKKGIN